MVQQTLEATKSFIFDVRPMVLDDLGLMPTLRRAARERASRSWDSRCLRVDGCGPAVVGRSRERPLPSVDEAIAAYLTARAERVDVKIDWSDQVEVTVAASRTMKEVAPDTTPDAAAAKDLPPALAAMMEERRASARDAVEAARRESIVVLPPSTWREIQAPRGDARDRGHPRRRRLRAAAGRVGGTALSARWWDARRLTRGLVVFAPPQPTQHSSLMPMTPSCG
jgi:hypothetical protein